MDVDKETFDVEKEKFLEDLAKWFMKSEIIEVRVGDAILRVGQIAQSLHDCRKIIRETRGSLDILLEG